MHYSHVVTVLYSTILLHHIQHEWSSESHRSDQVLFPSQGHGLRRAVSDFGDSWGGARLGAAQSHQSASRPAVLPRISIKHQQEVTLTQENINTSDSCGYMQKNKCIAFCEWYNTFCRCAKESRLYLYKLKSKTIPKCLELPNIPWTVQMETLRREWRCQWNPEGDAYDRHGWKQAWMLIFFLQTSEVGWKPLTEKPAVVCFGIIGSWLVNMHSCLHSSAVVKERSNVKDDNRAGAQQKNRRKTIISVLCHWHLIAEEATTKASFSRYLIWVLEKENILVSYFRPARCREPQ